MIKRNLLTGVAAAAVVAFASPQAFAFNDTLDWDWYADVKSEVDVDIDVVADIGDPSGLVQVEVEQKQIGDVTATSNVRNITNNQYGGSGEVTFTFQGEAIDNASLPDDVDGFEYVTVDSEGIAEGQDIADKTFASPPADSPDVDDLDGSVVATSDNVDADDITVEGGIGLDANGEDEGDENMVAFTVTIDDVAPSGTYDAKIDLPTVDSAATAVGNNASVSSEVATLLHVDQKYMGDFGFDDHVPSVTGKVTARSNVRGIENARVDSVATAVGNNFSGELTGANTATNTDLVLVADITQFSMADVTASSTVRNVTVNDYMNLGAAKVSPLVNSAATAVGNNLSIKVGDIGTDD